MKLSTLVLSALIFFGFAESHAKSKTPATPIYKGTAKFVVKPEHVDAFKKAVEKIIAPTRKEAGCISYEAFQVIEKGHVTNKFEFHELWKSEQAMMIDHKDKAPHMQEFFKTVAIGTPASLVESFEVSGHNVKELN
jgi:quinol monooxygenase YgiN